MKNRVNQFIELRSLYEEFAAAVEELLKKVADNSKLKVVTQKRAKSIASFSDKILKPEFKERQLHEIHDLAGARCILYLEDELTIFTINLKKTIGYEQIEDEKSKFSLTDYNARHIVFKVKEDNILEIPFGKFKGMCCEIQITSILLHPWNELSHLMLYKDPERIELFAPEEFEQNKRDLVEIVNKHLWEATNKLNASARVHKELVKAKNHFSESKFQSSTKSNDYNFVISYLLDTKNFLEKYKIYTYNQFDFISWAYKLREKWRKKDLVQGKYKYPHIHSTTQQIVSILKYFSPQEAFYFLIEDYFSNNAYVQKEASEKLNNWFKIDSWRLKNLGLSQQIFLLNELATWNDNEINSTFDLILSLLNQLLKIEFEDSSMTDYRTFSIGHRHFLPTHNVQSLREKTLTFLYKLLSIAKTSKRKKQILTSIFESGRTGLYNRGNKALFQMITKEMTVYLKKLSNDVSQLDLESLRYLNVHLTRINLKKIKVARIKSSLQIKINKIPDYTLYKEIIASPEDLPNFNYSERESKISIRHTEIALEIIAGEYFEWERKLLKFYKLLMDSNSDRSYIFGQFINILAACNPEFGNFLLDRDTTISRNYYYALFLGLKDKYSLNEKRTRLRVALKSKHNRIAAMKAAFSLELHTKTMIVQFLKDSENQNDVEIMLTEINLSGASDKLKAYTFKKCIPYLNKWKTCKWPLWWVKNMSELFPLLTKHDLVALVRNLGFADGENYHVQHILKQLIDLDPNLIIQYFEILITNGSNRTDFPYEMNILASHIRIKKIDISSLIIDKIDIKNYEDPYSAMLNLLVPVLTPELEETLLKKVYHDLEENIVFVLNILRRYSGGSSVDSIVLKLVTLTKNSEKYTTDLIHIVEFYRQVYSGEFGIVEILRSTLERVHHWEITDQFQLDFKKRIIKYLEKSIADEEKFINTDIAQQKIGFERHQSMKNDSE